MSASSAVPLSVRNRANIVAIATWITVCQIASTQPIDRLIAPIKSHRMVTLQGSRNPRIEKLLDDGPLEETRPVRGLSFRFKTTPTQSAALEQLLEDQQNPSSPLYHAWLTPEEYGERFGLSSNDLSKVTTWLESQGFQIDSTARSRTWIVFSGTAGQVRDTFRTELHRYTGAGKLNIANAVEAQIPADLEPLIYTIRGLDDFQSRSASRPKPLLNTSVGHALIPGDLAVIYNINPLYQKGIDGTGQKIMVVGQSGIRLSDIQSFRSQFGLPKNDPRVVLAPGYGDPGVTEEDAAEAALDVEYAGGMAPKASIIFVYSPHIELSEEYAVDQNYAPVISDSYSICEKTVAAHPGKTEEYRSVAQQAIAQGITWVNDSHDAGPAGCELQLVDAAGVSGMSVNVPASIPEVTGVGATSLNEGTGKYWNQDAGRDSVSALSYIPEIAWNQTAIEGTLAASGGGASVLYPRPTWQTVKGVPNDSRRHVPDISFAGDFYHDPYVITVNGELLGSGGTSASTPLFAGVLALLNQYLVANGTQSRPGLGNINPKLYQLAQSTTGVFHDITSGNNIIPCKFGTPDCTTGRYGYNAGPGYDEVTGLGSIDINNLFNNWSGPPSTPGLVSTTLTVTANPPSISAKSSTILTATVKAASGSASPTGSVAFSLGSTTLGSASLSGSGATATASLSVSASQLGIGSNTIAVTYADTAAFGHSSSAITVTVTAPAAPSSVVLSADPTPVYQQKADADGYSWFYTVRLTETAGASTTITALSIDGVDYSANFASWFGSATLSANGTLACGFRAKELTVPMNQVFSFSGVDATGERWTKQVTIPFLSQKTSASMALSSSPSILVKNPNPDPSCSADYPFLQQVNLQEQNGSEVRLTKLIVDSQDMSDQISNWFGSLRLAPFGTLRADFCWQIATVPSTINLEVDGVDNAGNAIKATLSTQIKVAGQPPSTLAVSKTAIALSSVPSGLDIGSLSISLPSTENWTLSTLPANQQSSWLAISQKSGKGPAQLTLTALARGLPNGVYTTTLIVESLYSVPSFINVPVTFTIGASKTTAITGLQNAASFQQVFAPGMIMSVYGNKLANATQSAQSAPLPLSMAGVSATVNGVAAPLYFISTGLINLQIPYETAVGPAIVAVNNNGEVSAFTFQVSAIAPGIFNSSGAVVPAASAKRGSAVAIYITGDGELSPMVDTGAPPAADTPVAQLPKPRGVVSVTVGRVKADVAFAGNPWLVGITQINFTVPANAPLGAQPVVVTVGGVASAVEMLTVQ
jgi:uncharacterized protein (TIGR03437 family)